MAGNQLDGSYIINIDNLVFSTKEVKHYPRRGGIYGKNSVDMPLIRKIENNIRHKDKEAYEPNIISIGPYHHGNMHTKAMEMMKYECLDYILKLNKEKKLDDYMKAIKGMDKEIRNYYGDDIGMDRNNFLKMLLLDGCFVILTLHGVNGISPAMNMNTQNTKIRMRIDENIGETILDVEVFEVREMERNNQTTCHNTKLNTDLIINDMLLLENQIPSFIITKIYEIAAGESNNFSLLMESITGYIEDTIECYLTSKTAFNRPKDFHHLLHMCHMYFKPNEEKLERRKHPISQPYHWNRATEYDKSGILLKKRDFCSDNPHSLLDIDFYNGTMEIPCLNINHNTRCLFRNLLAFEYSCPQIGNYVTAYIIFWSQFMKTPDDVALLMKRGIIVHQLNSDAEVSDLFTKLKEDIVFDFDHHWYLSSTYYEMEEHYQKNKLRLMTLHGKVASQFSRALSAVTQKSMRTFAHT